MIRVGIVGMGFIGQQHFRVHQGLEEMELVAVADRVPERVAEQTPALGGNIGEAQPLDLSALGRYTSLEDLLAQSEVDCVDLCTPTFVHAELTVQALEAGKHVICEKPMALTPEECARMIDAAQANQRLLFIAQCIRFWPAYEVLAEMVAGGDLGRVALAKFTRLSATPMWSESNWSLDPSLSGGALLDLHIHDVDFIASVWGTAPAVQAQGISLITEGQKVDHVIASYLYDDFVCIAEGGWAMPGGFPFTMSYQVLGEKGLLTWAASEGPAPTFYPREGEPYSLEVSPETGYQREMQYFVECMESGQPPERVTPESAREAVRIVHAEAASIRTNAPVEL